MSPENVEVVKTYFAVWNSADADALRMTSSTSRTTSSRGLCGTGPLAFVAYFLRKAPVPRKAFCALQNCEAS